ncbi:hypothetical protein [Pedobacter sp. D749]|uniref:hypothetical protein n=1 Tax=Pedobacter sp. D749 TaxID=2856523 RepID=UPI001C56819A|nr:hypothetical protein [Pedobacter sp. D749]QXU42936.1 hypothetical protein KYH19_04885 [Pedobacter sp. D749]
MKKLNYLSIALILLFIISSCKKQEEYVINDKLNPDEIINITSIQPGSFAADSNSKYIIRVQINSRTDSAVSVNLTTTSGLINSKSRSETMRVNVNRYADFILTAGQTPGPISLRASVLSTFFRDTILTFTKSYPDTILLHPEAYTIAKNSSVVANIQLIKNMGFPSKNQTIFLSALDISGNNIGRFTYTGSYSPGAVISGSFSPPTDYIGVVTLVTTVVKEDGGKIVGKNNINVQ